MLHKTAKYIGVLAENMHNAPSLHTKIIIIKIICNALYIEIPFLCGLNPLVEEYAHVYVCALDLSTLTISAYNIIIVLIKIFTC